MATERLEIDVAGMSKSTALILEFKDLQRKICPLLILTRRAPETEFERSIFHRSIQEDTVTTETIQLCKDLLLQLEQKVAEQKVLYVRKITEIRERLNDMEGKENLELGYSVSSCILLDQLHDLTAALCRVSDQKNLLISSGVTEIRAELQQLWRECMLQGNEGDFPELHTGEFSEHVLNIHKEQLAKWKLYYKKNQALFRQVEKRELLWQRMKELHVLNQDPNRFINRGGTLLKTQKEMQQITSALPKCEEKLKSLAKEFERENGKQVYIQGKEVSELIESDWNAFKQPNITSRKTLRPQPVSAKCETPANKKGLPYPGSLRSADKRLLLRSNPNLSTKRGRIDENLEQENF